jgi:LTXXQ motif family protein
LRHQCESTAARDQCAEPFSPLRLRPKLHDLIVQLTITTNSNGSYPRKEDAVRKSLFLMSSAALIGFSALSIPAMARDKVDRAEMTANQLVDQSDARTAQLKVALHLTPDQEKNWGGFESAMQEMGKKRADRMIAMRDERLKDSNASSDSKDSNDSKEQASIDVLDQINRRADLQIARSNDWKKLADAAKPFYASLDEQQKQRFAAGLFSDARERDQDSN